ncbi:MAG: DNA/RNA nuclease SfsA [Acidobacteriota bacterium]
MFRCGDPGDSPLLLTEPLRAAQFVERANRFSLAFQDGDQTGTAYLANSGRLEEILLPGTELLLAARPHRRLVWEALGARFKSRWPDDPPRTVFLNSSLCNRIVRELLRRKLIEDLVEWDIVGEEHKTGSSRIDFLLGQGDRRYYLEVKSVTLCEHGIAFFPDACTERGRRHLIELATTQPPHRAGILFLVQGEARFFLPDFHNDLAFARAFRSVSERLDILAVNLNPVLTGDDQICFSGTPRKLPVAWDLVDRGIEDFGVYLLVLRIEQEQTIEIASLGERRFPEGWYIYVGSGRRNLTRRIERHLRRRKRFHYHIDHLRARAARVRVLAIRGSGLEECQLAGLVSAIALSKIPNFGCSDCDCASHLYYFKSKPTHLPEFQRLLVAVRHAFDAGRSRHHSCWHGDKVTR